MILTELRLRIDGVAQIVGSLISSEELNSCQKKLYFAKAWAGKLLGQLGVDSPYKNDGKRKTISDIEPTNDVIDISSEVPNMIGKSHVQIVDEIRQDVQKLIDLVETLEMSPKPTREMSICRTNIWNYLCEARFELGFELGRLHKENS